MAIFDKTLLVCHIEETGAPVAELAEGIAERGKGLKKRFGKVFSFVEGNKERFLKALYLLEDAMAERDNVGGVVSFDLHFTSSPEMERLSPMSTVEEVLAQLAPGGVNLACHIATGVMQELLGYIRPGEVLVVVADARLFTALVPSEVAGKLPFRPREGDFYIFTANWRKRMVTAEYFAGLPEQLH